ncbi:MAG: hypothetical protein KJ732_03070 [Candidatus Margulisbacteria bacterium]|nr:hypothetical protein [Candidatus Margulisiibacteriota bacterium]
MSEQEKSALEKLEQKLKDMWRSSGKASIIAARYTEFVVEPKVFIGDKLHPEILKIMIINYLANSATQDSGIGNVEVTPDKLIIKGENGKELVAVRDKKIIRQYLAQQA